MCTARPGWQTISPQNMAYKNRMYPIKVNLVDILDIDTERQGTSQIVRPKHDLDLESAAGKW